MFNREQKANEEQALREAMAVHIKNPRWYNGKDAYSKVVNSFLSYGIYDMDKFVELLTSRISMFHEIPSIKTSWKTYAGTLQDTSNSLFKTNEDFLKVSSIRSENLLDIIRYISKYNLEERCLIRSKLAKAVIVRNDNL